MKRKDVLDLILYNSIPYELPDSTDGWYEYRICIADGETFHIEANDGSDYGEGIVRGYPQYPPKYKVRSTWISPKP